MSDQTDFLLRLDLEPTSDERAVKRAYARELKKIDIEANPDGFQELRWAYERAQTWLSDRNRKEEECSRSASLPCSFPSPTPGPAEQIDSRQDTGDDARQDLASNQIVCAEEAFEEFLHALSLTPEDSNAITLALSRQLRDPRLEALDARNFFEYQLATYLSQGWRPGSHHLLEVAAFTFDWSSDHSRLAALGIGDAVLGKALLQLEMIKDFMPVQRKSCFDLLDKIRHAVPPGISLFQDSGAVITALSRVAPDYLALAVPGDSVSDWKEFANRRKFWLDNRVERFLCKARGLEPPRHAWMRLRLPRVPLYAWVILVCIHAIFYFGEDPPEPQESSPRVEISTLSPKDKLEYLVQQPADERNCNALSDVAHANRMGQPKPSLDFNSSAEEKVGECIAKGYWLFVDDPLTGKDPAVEQALRPRK